ncbi:MAG TPA: response regulator [Thermoanaerobaculia bacterium]|nr:response regulator [Thermoanaerobaculia bacterium]
MSRRILLADDSVTIQKVIELTFMDEDFEVSAVSNGDEAVALLAQLQPEFVIADVHMPGANGYEVCRRSKALKPEVPVLLLVGTFEPFDEAQARAAGSDAFLKKPFDSQELLHIVQGLLDKADHGGAAGFAAAPAAAQPSLAPLPPLALETEADAPWSSFEIEAEPEPLPPPAAPPASPGYAWSSPSLTPELGSPEEQLFELEPAEELALDDSLLPSEEPFSLAADGGISGIGGIGAREFAEAHAPAFPGERSREATPEERIGVPFGAAPLAGSLSEVEHSIAEHALPELPDWSPATPAAPAPAPAPAPPAAVPATSSTSSTSSGFSTPSTGAEGTAGAAGPLSDADVDRIARRIIELVGEKVIRDVAWEVVPDLAEVVIKDRLRELESQVE